MQKKMLQISQYVVKHPIMVESEDYKKKYINTLEYFVRKYSSKGKYSQSMLELYKNRLMEQPELYDYKDEELKKISYNISKEQQNGFVWTSAQAGTLSAKPEYSITISNR